MKNKLNYNAMLKSAISSLNAKSNEYKSLQIELTKMWGFNDNGGYWMLDKYDDTRIKMQTVENEMWELWSRINSIKYEILMIEKG